MVKANTKCGRTTTCRTCLAEKRKRERKSKFHDVKVTENTCSKCGVTKSALEFYRDSLSTTGLGSQCKLCCSKTSKAHSLKHKDRISKDRKAYREANKELISIQKRNSMLRNPEKHLLQSSIQRAGRSGLEHTITLSDITIPSVCPLLKIPLKVGTKDNYTSSPSLDRIDNTKGYIPGNVWVISSKANTMKNSATFAELRLFCENITKLLL